VRTITLPDAAMQSMLEGFAQLHALVLAVDAERRVTWLHDDFEIVVGGPSLAIGRPVGVLVDELWAHEPATFRTETKRFVDEMLDSESVAGARIDLTLNGATLALDVSAFHALDAAGNDTMICVADRHEKRESLAQKNEELETYVRGVSHDLRSPLVSLLGFSRMLRDDYEDKLEETGLHFLDRIEQAGQHMQQLLHDMLELSRIGETSQCQVRVHPTPILEQLYSELKPQLDEKEIDLRLPDDPPTLLFDRTRLYQLFSNLIGNAVQHLAPAAKGRIDVEIETQAKGWLISVSDNGAGIAPEDQERIFGVFQTGRKSNSREKSSGLGLAIVKKIVEMHSGRVWVESQPEAGARFLIWLPED
jgi:signal transduction histidine kinase